MADKSEVKQVPKKMGRPTDNPKDDRITVRLDKESAEILADYCKRNGVDRAAAVRKAIKLLSDDNKQA